MFPLISAPNYIDSNIFLETKNYSSFTIEQPRLKNTIEFNTITSEEFIRENNEKILQEIYKTSEADCDSNSMVE